MDNPPVKDPIDTNVPAARAEAQSRGPLSRFSETQLVIMGIWLGMPIVAFILLWLINPVYEMELFAPDSISTGTILLIGCTILEIINAPTLYFGFRLINHSLPEDPSRRVGRAVWISLLAILTFLLCTLPILAITLLGPAAIAISRTR